MTASRIVWKQRNVELAHGVGDAERAIPLSGAHAVDCDIDVGVRSKTSPRERSKEKDTRGTQLLVEAASKDTRDFQRCARSIGFVASRSQARLI
jgi:hypothetical protein